MFPLQGGIGLIPGWGIKILRATRHGQKKKNLTKLFKDKQPESLYDQLWGGVGSWLLSEG